MLLELRQLSQGLNAAKVTVEEMDDRLVTYSVNKTLFRVKLSHVGNVVAVERLQSEIAETLVKFRVSKGGSQESIPGFNIPPLFIAKEMKWHDVAESVKQFSRKLKRPSKNDTPGSRKIELDTILDQCEPDWATKRKAISKCLKEAGNSLSELLVHANEADHENLAPLVELLRRASLLNPDRLQDELQAHVREELIGAADGVEEFLKLLIRRKKAKAGNDPDSVQIMFELAEDEGMPANHQTVWRAVKRLLVTGRHAAPMGQDVDSMRPVAIKDAFGEVGPENNKKLPQVNLPVLGTVILRSLVKTKPCQTRYGMTEGDSFPLSRDTPPPLAEALDWLTAREFEGKTYREVSEAGGFTRKALLLAYPDPLPKYPPAIAAILAKTGREGPTPPEARFVAAAELVVNQLSNLIQQTPSTRVRVFVLAKGKKPPTKLLLSRQFAAERIVHAVSDWRSAADNTPPIFARLRGEDKQSRWIRCNEIPFPSEVARCLNRVWQRGGERVEIVAVFDFGSALTLILDDGQLLAELARRSLRLAVTQWIDLLLAMSQAATLGEVCNFSPNEQLLLPPILGLLLFKLGQPKEMYMKATPYWLGRLMAVADKLHRNYCERERDGKIPNGPLIGNAAMSVCLENPQAGLARLSERITLYQQVAGEWLGAELAEIISHIDADTLPKRATDEHKAQMLLGYLARPELLRSVSTIENQS